MKIAGIRFRDNWRVYDFDASDVDIRVGDDVIVDSDRGPGFARVVRLREGDALPEPSSSSPDQKERSGGKKEDARTEHEEEVEIEVETPGSASKEAQNVPTKQPAKGHRKVVRKATEDDQQRAAKNRGREAEAFRLCQDMVAERELPMKLIRAEYSFDGSRVTFYFFSETRVDFRELVKDLAHRLRTRIEMRQVGVRDVARMIGGFGPCGRELCCTSFLRGFEPVSIRMAKKQEMVLNPAKISGVCGRLLCCLSYEHAMYDAIKKDLAEMKEASVREKKAEEERRLTEQRREVEEQQRQAEEQRRQDDDRRKQEERQRERQRPAEPSREGKSQEKKKEGQRDKKQRPPQEQRQREQQAPQGKQQRAAEQQPRADDQGREPVEQAQPQTEKGQGKKRRRFWRKKKKKPGGQQQEGRPQGTPGGGPAT
jgi:cell fate regulator YaaT (PSP1 superfamily)